MQQLIDRVRFYHYIAGVLENQGNDPLCGKCRAHTNTLSAVKEGLDELKSGKLGPLSEETMELLDQVRNRIYSIRTSGSTEGQKKAGNCKMPKGICFVKSSNAISNEI